MFKQAVFVVVFGMLIAACTPRPAPPGDDRTPPLITLTALESTPPQSFNTDEGPTSPVDACAEVRAFPSTVTVAATDVGGIRDLRIRVYWGRLTDASAAPATADVTVDRFGAADRLVVAPRPPAGTVQPNVVTTFDVTDESSILAEATDETGNDSYLFQVDIWERGSSIVCRGE